MQLDEKGHLLIVGRHIYRVDVNAFMEKFVNPFSYNSFEWWKSIRNQVWWKEPRTACVQVRPQANMPAYDLFAGYLLGLMNDEVTYCTARAPPTDLVRNLRARSIPRSHQEHGKALGNAMDGCFDFGEDTFTFDGTNGWKWRLHFGLPLNKGFKN